jgi:photosystem II stability/assembly factor-like uncharacterized protein
MYPTTLLGGLLIAGITLIASALATGAIGLPSRADEHQKGGHPELQPLSGPTVRDGELFTSGSGYVLNTSGIFWTEDFGATWQDITPAGFQPAQIIAVEFLMDGEGWLSVDSEDGFTVLHNGANRGDWVPAQELDTVVALEKVREFGAQPQTDLSFVDSQNGWLLINTYPRTIFSTGALFATNDGGITWSELPAPAFGRIKFVSPEVGYFVGGPANTKLFVTSDGGGSWSEADTSDSKSHGTDIRTLSGEALQLNGEVAVGVSWITTAGVNNGFGLLITRDNGRTWGLNEQPSSPDYVQYAFASVPGSPTVSIYTTTVQGPAIVLMSKDAGTSFTQTLTDFPTPTGPAGVHLSMANASHLWLVGAIGSCRSPDGQDCFQSSGLFDSDNGGQTWTQVSTP